MISERIVSSSTEESLSDFDISFEETKPSREEVEFKPFRSYCSKEEGL
jgi:hypothetical protein